MQKNCIVNKPTIVNRFGLRTLHCNITPLAVLTPKMTSKIKKLEMCGDVEKSPVDYA